MRRHLKKKPIKAKSNGYLLSVHGHAHLTHLVSIELWSALCCLLVTCSSAVSIASRLASAAKLLLQTITKVLTLQCATRRGFREICSFVIRSFIHSVCPMSCRDHRSLLKLGKGINRLSMTMACNVTRGFC